VLFDVRVSFPSNVSNPDANAANSSSYHICNERCFEAVPFVSPESFHLTRSQNSKSPNSQMNAAQPFFRHEYWILATMFGARCTRELGPGVTHLVTTSVRRSLMRADESSSSLSPRPKRPRKHRISRVSKSYTANG
jgi:hypothetical protein